MNLIRLKNCIFLVFSLFLAAILLGSTAAAEDARYTHFKDLSAFTLNGHAAEIAKKPDRGGALRLTDNLWQGGSAFLTKPISIADDASFSSHFIFQITNPLGISDGVQGADGIVFAVQTMASKVGSVGGGIGYQGVTPSVAIEFDTWPNGSESGNHVGININGNTNSVDMKDIETPINNGEKWYAWVDYNGATDTIEVRLSQNSTRPQAFLLQQNIDLVNVLGKTDVFVGFSSGTGAAGNTHDILSWEFRGSFDPIGESVSKHGTLTVLGEGEGVAAPGQVELILDASGSMVGKTSDGERKIDVAKRVIRVLTEKLPKNMLVALRVYGHRLPREPKAKSCTDSELVSPFTPLGKSNFNTILSNIHPKGQTPIGFSLSKLTDDFENMPGEKLVVLVSDGIETCNSDPNDPLFPPRILKSLLDKGVKVKVNVIGFDIGKSETRAFLKSIADASNGMYFNASNAKELDKSISKAISAKFDFSDVNGSTVLNGTVGDKSLTVNAGTYTLKIHANPDIVIPNVTIEGGKETNVFVRKSKGGTDVKKTISELTKEK